MNKAFEKDSLKIDHFENVADNEIWNKTVEKKTSGENINDDDDICH